MERMKKPIIFKAGHYIPLSRQTFIAVGNPDVLKRGVSGVDIPISSILCSSSVSLASSKPTPTYPNTQTVYSPT